MGGLPGADTRGRAVVDQASATPPLQVVLGDHCGILTEWAAGHKPLAPATLQSAKQIHHVWFGSRLRSDGQSAS